MKIKQPTPQLIAYLDDLKAVIGRHKHLTPEEMLAGCAQLVGNLIALQDQRKFTPDSIMEMVGRNIEVGNAAVVEPLQSFEGVRQ